MIPTPARGRWIRVLVVAAVTVAVIAVGYFAVVRPLNEVGAGSSPTAGADVGGGPQRPPPESQSPGATALAAPVVPGDPAQGPSGMAMPVGDLPGWRQVHADDFSGNRLGTDWFAYEGQPEKDAGGYFAPSHVSVADGLLTIEGYREPSRRNIYVTGGVAQRKALAQSYGRYDVRFRMDLGKGIAYALLLWPATNKYPPEIDFAEDNGRDRRVMYASLHPPGGGKTDSRSLEGDFTQWHTVGLEWTPGNLAFTIDGKPWATIPGGGVPTEPMTLALQTQAWYCGHNWEACPDSSTPQRVDLDVDWAVVYAWEG